MSRSKYGPRKFGDTREDGMVFRQYCKRGDGIIECWVSRESFERFKASANERSKSLAGEKLEKRKAAIKRWKQNNRSKYLEINRRHKLSEAYMKNRFLPKNRLARRLNSRIKKVLKTSCESTTASRLLGCQISEAVKALESTMPAGCTWNDVHIDHELPCSFFDMDDCRDRAYCFSIKNLRLLKSRDNLVKRDKLPSWFKAAQEPALLN